jgi:2Fe-2S ferredoxin
MAKVTYIRPDGEKQIVDAPLGESLMQVALDNLVPGILGDCGGCCSCATCHVYVDPTWVPLLEPASADETMMLQGGPDVRETSRLACQIPMRAELDGIVLYVPGEAN